MSVHHSSDDSAQGPTTASVTDSPWFWLALFLVGALLALLLTAPKYSWRQPQIERRYQARERSGQAVSATGGAAPYSRRSESLLTLRPLIAFFSLVLIVAAALFWFRRLGLYRRKNGRNDGQPAANRLPPAEGPEG